MGNCGQNFFPATIRSGGLINEEEATGLKGLICSAPDLERLFSHIWVGGVRRVSKIEMVSASVNAVVDPDVKLVRTFYYQMTAPFDLLSIADAIVSV